MRFTTCPLDCFDGCSIAVTNDLKLKGNKAHPITQGFLCHHPEQSTSVKIFRRQKTRKDCEGEGFQSLPFSRTFPAFKFVPCFRRQTEAFFWER